MAKWVHRVTSYDEDAGMVECQNCGVVPVTIRRVRGKPAPRCSVAVKEQKHWRAHYRKTRRNCAGQTRNEASAFMEGKACAICGRDTNLCVDHDHDTGAIRDVLCRPCNAAIGLLGDNADQVLRAAKYLQKHETLSGETDRGSGQA